MMLVVDNYDSFTYNLVQYLGEMKTTMTIVRNDEIHVEKVQELNPARILISPGPCTPKEAGQSNKIIQAYAGKRPILGVCLGHQCIAHVFNAKVRVNYRVMHGKTSPIKHNNRELFKNIPNPFTATRYHSLIVDRKNLPDCLEITAETEEGEIMGIRHREFPLWGVQFHPESILTEHGKDLLKNFLSLC